VVQRKGKDFFRHVEKKTVRRWQEEEKEEQLDPRAIRMHQNFIEKVVIAFNHLCSLRESLERSAGLRFSCSGVSLAIVTCAPNDVEDVYLAVAVDVSVGTILGVVALLAVASSDLHDVEDVYVEVSVYVACC